ncbi:MAG: AAA family ATPase [Patescibacteria group bacterium]|jgi:hypothetical protein
MGAEAAFKDELKSGYDEDLHARFVLWKDQSGKSLKVIAGMINRSTAAISQYINKIYPGNVVELEKDLANLLDRSEDLQFVSGTKNFVSTNASILIWEVLQFCDKTQQMGAALAPSGTGKTETCREYKRKNRATVYVTADIATKTASQVMRRVIEHVGGVGRRNSVSEYLQALIERLRGTNRLLIIDDAHFLSWEAFELIRKLHDCAGIGVVYVGQERLYEQMKGTEGRAYLFDQIYSRIAIKRDKFSILKNDVKAVATSHFSDLPNNCIDFLFSRAKGKGRYRYITNLLRVSGMMVEQHNTEMSVELLQEAEQFLLGE